LQAEEHIVSRIDELEEYILYFLKGHFTRAVAHRERPDSKQRGSVPALETTCWSLLEGRQDRNELDCERDNGAFGANRGGCFAKVVAQLAIGEGALTAFGNIDRDCCAITRPHFLHLPEFRPGKWLQLRRAAVQAPAEWDSPAACYTAKMHYRARKMLEDQQEKDSVRDRPSIGATSLSNSMILDAAQVPVSVPRCIEMLGED